MNVCSPNRLSDHCRTGGDTRRRKRPFSWSDKYLEESRSPCWENTWALSLSHCVTQTTPLPEVCEWCACLCLWVDMCAHGRPKSPPSSYLYLYSISTPLPLASVLLAKYVKETRTSALLKAKEAKEFGPETCLVSCVGLLINQPGCQHCIATTSGWAKSSIGEPRTDTTGLFMAAAGMGSDLEWGEGTLAPQYCFEPARLM